MPFPGGSSGDGVFCVYVRDAVPDPVCLVIVPDGGMVVMSVDLNETVFVLVAGSVAVSVMPLMVYVSPCAMSYALLESVSIYVPLVVVSLLESSYVMVPSASIDAPTMSMLFGAGSCVRGWTALIVIVFYATLSAFEFLT